MKRKKSCRSKRKDKKAKRTKTIQWQKFFWLLENFCDYGKWGDDLNIHELIILQEIRKQYERPNKVFLVSTPTNADIFAEKYITSGGKINLVGPTPYKSKNEKIKRIIIDEIK